MPLWLLFTFAFLLLAGSSAGAVWYFTTSVLYPLVSEQSYVYLSFETAFLIAFFLVIIGILFLALGRVIASPMHKLNEAAKAYAKHGIRLPLVIPSFAPSEVRELVRSFVELMGSVETVHKRDTEVSRVKSDFISTAAHQLRTPLTGIRWALEALEKDTLTEEQHALVASASEKSHELVAIVGTLLDISAIESGKYKYTFAMMDVNVLAAEVKNDLDALAKERQITLAYQPTSPLPQVRADRERMKWVLTNLVENAIRYTPSPGTVTIGTSTGPSRAFITVRDTGIGIPSEDRNNIFERFFRAGNAIAKENQGNGLGLYIARTIAIDHGGDLNFAGNKEGPGTTFTLSLPAAGAA